MSQKKKSSKKKGSAGAGTWRTRLSTARRSVSSKLSGKDDSGNRILTVTIRILAVVAAVALIVGLWRGRVDCSLGNLAQCARDIPSMTGKGDGFPITVTGGTTLQLDEISGGIAVLTDSTFSIFNHSSKQAVSRAHHMSNPGMKTAGRYALVFDIGKKLVRLETASDTLAELSCHGTIVSGAISRNGRFAVALSAPEDGTSAISRVVVYDKSGQWIYRYNTSTHYINDIALSPDGKYIAMSGITAKDGIMQSTLMIHKVLENTDGMTEDEIRKKAVVATFEQPDNTFLSLEFTNTNTLFAIGTAKVFIVDDFGKSSRVVDLVGSLMAFDVDYDCGAAVYTTEILDGDIGNLQLFDTRGQLRFAKEVPLYGVSVSLDTTGCCVLGRGELHCYRLSGEQLGRWDAGVTASSVQMIDRRAYISDGITIKPTELTATDSDK